MLAIAGSADCCVSKLLVKLLPFLGDKAADVVATIIKRSFELYEDDETDNGCCKKDYYWQLALQERLDLLLECPGGDLQSFKYYPWRCYESALRRKCSSRRGDLGFACP